MLRRGHAMRLECRGPDPCVTVLLFSAADPVERLCLPDTLKAQMSAYVRAPMVLMSDDGRALCSVRGSSVDWHDALTGHSLDADVLARYGPSSYAADGNAWRQSARAGLLDELWSRGLGERDLHASINFFVKVVAADDDRGTLSLVPGNATTGDWVELRAEVDTLVVLSTAPHPDSASPRWDPAGVRITTAAVAPPDAEDPSRTHRPEAARALAASERAER